MFPYTEYTNERAVEINVFFQNLLDLGSWTISLGILETTQILSQTLPGRLVLE